MNLHHPDNRPAHAGSGSGSGSRPSVPYGQACTNCSKAKCKCINGRGHGAPCERCSRLNKECRPTVSVRKRTVRRSATARTAQLEEKLDDLVAILRAQTAGTSSSSSSSSSSTNPPAAGGFDSVSPPNAAALDLNAYVRRNLINNPVVDTTNNTCTHEAPGGAATSYPTPSSSSVASSWHDIGLPPAEAEEALQLFREQHLRFFPFVYIAPETTAAQLARSRPFLWLNIWTLCCKSASQQQALSVRCREVLAQKALVDLDRDIDLLLGLLCYLGWAMHHFPGKPYLVSLTSLAVSLVTDLRLDKPVQEHLSARDISCFKAPYSFPRPPAGTPPRTNEDRRAVLACFVFCSTVSSFLRSQSMRWAPQMEDMLQKLASEPECPGDELLVAIVRVYKIMEEIAQVTWRSSSGNCWDGSTSSSSRPPPVLYVKALRANLEDIRRDLPPSLVGNRVMTSFLHATELAIADMPLWHTNSSLTSLMASPAPKPQAKAKPEQQQPEPEPIASSSSSSSSSTGGGVADLGKLDAYYGSLRACSASLDNLLGLAAADYVGLSFPIVLHFGRATQVVYRLLLLADDPDWDRGAAFAAAAATATPASDLFGVMQRVAWNFDQVPLLYGFRSDGGGGGGGSAPGDGGGGAGDECLDFYTKCAHALRATIPIWSASLEQLGVVGAPGTGTGMGEGASGTAAPGVGTATVLTSTNTDISAGAGAAAGAMFPVGMEQTGFGWAEILDFENEAWLADVLRTWDG